MSWRERMSRVRCFFGRKPEPLTTAKEERATLIEMLREIEDMARAQAYTVSTSDKARDLLLDGAQELRVVREELEREMAND